MDKSRLGARRPVRSWRIEAPRNSLKTPENSQKSSLTQRPGSPAAQDAQRAQQSNSETPVKKLRFLPFLFSTHQVYAPGAPGRFFHTNPQKTGKNFWDAGWLSRKQVYGYTRPGHKLVSWRYRKDRNAWFFTWDLTSPEAPAAGLRCVAAAGVAAVAAARQSNSKLPEINNKLIRSVVLGALDWPGAPGTSVQVLLLRTCHQEWFVI